MRYKVEQLRDGSKTYFFIRDTHEMSISFWPSKFLKCLDVERKSPNTVKKTARSLAYYLNYLEEMKEGVKKVTELTYMEQRTLIDGFLIWLKQGKHYEKVTTRSPKNLTCNSILADVFRWYAFLEDEGVVVPLKVQANRNISFFSKEGVGFSLSQRTYDGYLRSEESVGRTIDRESIEKLIIACTNTRDQLLLLLLAETGFRIGELLGVKFQDVDFKNKKIHVCFRPDNENYALAKNAEYRSQLISDGAFNILQVYLAENRELFMNGCEYLLVNISGKNAGKAMKADTVYAMLRCLKAKTGIYATPHMLRHYFAKEMYRQKGDIVSVSRMLGHRSIKTTLRYLNIEEDEMCCVMEAYYANNKPLFDVDKLL